MSAANETAPEPASAPRTNVKHVFERGDHVELAERLLQMIASDAPVVCDMGQLHTYDATTGIYTPFDREAATRVLAGFASGGSRVMSSEDRQPTPLKLRKTDIDGAIEIAMRLASRKFFFSGDDVPRGVAFSNGFARVVGRDIKLVDHSPEHRALHAHRFPLSSNTSCPRWLAFLADTFRGDIDAKEKIACLQEYAGASLFGIATLYQQAAVCFGEGDNGKSVLMRVIKEAFPREAVSSIPPQKWSSDYHRAHLAGRLINIVGEMPESDILESESFKGVVDGTQLPARSPYEKPFEFCPRAGHLFSANALPATADHTPGFFRRWVVIEFNRVVSAEERNPHLAGEIVADELPAIVAWLVEGARRVLARGVYTIPASSVARVDRWKHEANPVALFVAEKTKPAVSDTDRATSADLFSAYVSWSELNKFKAVSRTTFGRRMGLLKLRSQHTRKGEAYPVRLLKHDEPNPRDMERALAEEAAQEARARAMHVEHDPADIETRAALTEGE